MRPTRRYVLILMMLILPLQWSWSVAASICQHETTGKSAHLGHHEHAHEHERTATATAEVKAVDPAKTEAPQSYDADCATCHGQCSLASVDVGALPLPHFDAVIRTDFVLYMPDHVPDGLLRPPLFHLV